MNRRTVLLAGTAVLFALSATASSAAPPSSESKHER